MWGIIGGSGFENFSGFETVKELDLNTPFGSASSGLRQVRVQGTDAIFVSRHGAKHEDLPTEVNYRANIYALKALGVTKIIAFSAVGSLQKDLVPGDLVVPNQYIDRTKGIRKHSFGGNGVVGHCSLAEPVWESGVSCVKELSSKLDFNTHFDKSYVCIEGPNFSTKHESHWYRSMNADIIGMTGFPEFALAREAGICYLPCSFVTDYDCWNEEVEHVTLAQVIDLMRKNNGKAFQLLENIITQDIKLDPACTEGGLKNGLMSSKENLSPEQLEWLAVLQK